MQDWNLCSYQAQTELNYTNFVIIEKESEFGGTWNVNTYPGCACDVPGIEYSFSFEKVRQWTPNYFPSQTETFQYLKSLATKYGLYDHIRFNTTVSGMKYDETQKIWRINVKTMDKKTESMTGNIVISGVGILNDKKILNFKNMDKFKGETWHSSEWNHSYDLKGKTIGIIGTGPTSIQVVQSLAKLPLKLYVFQDHYHMFYHGQELLIYPEIYGVLLILCHIYNQFEGQ